MKKTPKSQRLANSRWLKNNPNRQAHYRDKHDTRSFAKSASPAECRWMIGLAQQRLKIIQSHTRMAISNRQYCAKATAMYNSKKYSPEQIAKELDIDPSSVGALIINKGMCK